MVDIQGALPGREVARSRNAVRDPSEVGVPRLTLRGIRPHFLGQQGGSVIATNPLLLLDHPEVDLRELTSKDRIEIDGVIDGIERRLDLVLNRHAISAHTRCALTAEVGHLARFTTSLARRRWVRVEIGDVLGASSSGCVSDADTNDVIAVAQVMRSTSPVLGAETLRQALRNPAQTYNGCQKTALVAWGARQQVNESIRDHMDRLDPDSNRDLLVVIIAKCDPDSRNPNAEQRHLSDLLPNPLGDSTSMVLVSVPFAPLDFPSLGLSTLCETIEGLEPPIVYYAIPFAEAIGFSFYDWIALGKPQFQHLIGEWIFSPSLGASQPPEGYLEEVLYESTLSWFGDTDGRREPLELVSFSAVAEVLNMIEQASASVDAWASELASLEPKIIGFTSVFQQNVASLALAKRLKEECSELVTVFGGANWEGEMGRALFRCFPFVDVAVSGEAEVIFPDLVTRLLKKSSVSDLQGVISRPTREDDPPRPVASAPGPDLNSLPRPDFTDFFIQWQESSIRSAVPRRLLLESSRGCWWGGKEPLHFLWSQWRKDGLSKQASEPSYR